MLPLKKSSLIIFVNTLTLHLNYILIPTLIQFCKIVIFLKYLTIVKSSNIKS